MLVGITMEDNTETRFYIRVLHTHTHTHALYGSLGTRSHTPHTHIHVRYLTSWRIEIITLRQPRVGFYQLYNIDTTLNMYSLLTREKGNLLIASN